MIEPAETSYRFSLSGNQQIQVYNWVSGECVHNDMAAHTPAKTVYTSRTYPDHPPGHADTIKDSGHTLLILQVMLYIILYVILYTYHKLSSYLKTKAVYKSCQIRFFDSDYHEK